MSFNFVPKTTATPGLTFPASIITTTTGSVGAGDNKVIAPKTITNLFSTAAATTVASGFSLTPAPKTTNSAIGFGATPSTTTTFSLSGLNTTSTSSTLAFTPILSTTSAPSVVSTAPLKLSAALTPTTAAVPLTTTTASFNLTSLATTTSASLVTFTSSGLGGLAATAPTTTSAAITTTSAVVLPTTTALTYGQLEDSINKWTIDLEEQGKFFINQAKQLNAWDTLLVSNGDKILALNETIERIKQQQQQLDQELDFVLAQQNELDELSAPLEKQLSEIPITDQSRYQTYQLSEVIDSQMKQMSEDLKEIIEHLNESNKNEDITDPVSQISRILNAHNNSLQWIDRNTSQISTHLEQIEQLHETYKKHNLNL